MAKTYLHQEIEREILTRIRKGTYPTGQRIPASKELAREFATSTVTVDRALTRLVERGYISRTARKGSFVTDPVNWSDFTQATRRNLVSLFMHQSPSAYFWNDAIQGIHDGLNAHGYQLLVNQTSGDPAATEEYLRSVSTGAVDAVLFVPLSMPSEEEYQHTNRALAATIEESGVSCVLFNRHLRDSDVSSAASDDGPGARWLTERLLARGSSDPVFITHRCMSSFMEREEAFVAVLEEHGFSDARERVVRLHPDHRRGSAEHRREVARFLEARPSCDGIFSVCADVLFLAVEELERIDPEGSRRLDIVNFDDIGHAPPWRVIAGAIPAAYQLGYIAADLITLKLNSWQDSHIDILQPCVLKDYTATGEAFEAPPTPSDGSTE